MCTATYFPLSTTGFILTHSRDEKVIRPAALAPKAFRIGDSDVTFPQDPQGQGTWIATSADTTVCLLNGAFTAHLPKPPYKHSRGLVIPHFFTYPSVDEFAEAYDFCSIEPFTLLVAERGRLVELRWNGKRLFTHEKDPERPHIWSSVTLYTHDVIEKREDWFRDWQQQHPAPSVEAIRWFHQHAGDGDRENSIRMNRQDALLTLSLTSIIHHDGQADLFYEDFTQDLFTHQTIRPSYATA
ncbi:NRDE family protein [uncultured Fibrella sp.]|uniref:NRDE family protein n=1 Tax=uncultured Fibrella sp. TaxID=1284596 RepID=UPI0035CB3CE5